MAFRFSDNILNNIEGSDFVVRKRVPRSMLLIIVFLSAFDFICFSAYLTGDTTVNSGFIFVLIISIGVLAGATFFFLNRFRKLILVTEFQTAMLASAAQIGTRFCFIVNTGGTIFYVDPGFQKVFSGFLANGCLTFMELLDFTQVPEEQKQRIFTSLQQKKSDNIILSFNGSDGEAVTTVTTIDVIQRPSGYFIIRGRDYVEKRTEVKSGDDNLAVILEKAICNMPGLVIIADNHGRIVSISNEFEQVLGYEPGEIVGAKMQVNQVLSKYNGPAASVALLENYTGTVMVRKKDHTMLAAGVNQALLVENNKAVGISAVINIGLV